MTQGIRAGTWDTINTLKFRAAAADDGATIRCVAEHRALKHNTMERRIELTVYCTLPQSATKIFALIKHPDHDKKTFLATYILLRPAGAAAGVGPREPRGERGRAGAGALRGQGGQPRPRAGLVPGQRQAAVPQPEVSRDQFGSVFLGKYTSS